MRWQQLFADLQAQFDEEEAAAERSESASRARAEMGAVRLSQRLLGSLGASVSVTCRGAGQVGGVLVDVGSDWLLLEDDRGRQNLVATAAVRAVAGLGRGAAPPEPAGAVRGTAGPAPCAAGTGARPRRRPGGPRRRGRADAGRWTGWARTTWSSRSTPLTCRDARRRCRGVRAIVIAAVAVVRTGDARPLLIRTGRSGLPAELSASVVSAAGRVGDGAGSGLGVLLLDEPLELVGLDAPLAAAADLDRDQLLAPHECVRLGPGDIQDLGDVVEGQEAGRGHRSSVRSPPVCQPHRWNVATVHTRTCGRRVRANAGMTHHLHPNAVMSRSGGSTARNAGVRLPKENLP